MSEGWRKSKEDSEEEKDFADEEGACGISEDAGASGNIHQAGTSHEEQSRNKRKVEQMDVEDEFELPDITMPLYSRISRMPDAKRLRLEIENVVSASNRLKTLTRELAEKPRMKMNIMTKETKVTKRFCSDPDEVMQEDSAATHLQAKKQKMEIDEGAAGRSHALSTHTIQVGLPPTGTESAARGLLQALGSTSEDSLKSTDDDPEAQFQNDFQRLKCLGEENEKLMDEINKIKRQIGEIHTVFKPIMLPDIASSLASLAQPAPDNFQMWKLKKERAQKTLKNTETLMEMITTATWDKKPTTDFQRSVKRFQVFLKEELDFEMNEEDRQRRLVQEHPSDPWFLAELRRYREQNRVHSENLNKIYTEYQVMVYSWLDKKVALSQTLLAKANTLVQKLAGSDEETLESFDDLDMSRIRIHI